MNTFDSIEKALEYTVRALIPRRHAYVVNVIGPKNSESNEPVEIQVVAQHMVYEDRECGLTVNLAFDTSSGEFTHLVEFMGSSISDLCDEYEWDDIPCFALRFGTDAATAAKAVRFLLTEVYGYKEPTAFQCEVNDEGGIE